jgi:hypothetical protein
MVEFIQNKQIKSKKITRKRRKTFSKDKDNNREGHLASVIRHSCLRLDCHPAIGIRHIKLKKIMTYTKIKRKKNKKYLKFNVRFEKNYFKSY